MIEDAFGSNGRAAVKCVCGIEKSVLSQTLRQGKAKSCGAKACRYVSGPIEPVDHRRIRPEDITDEDLRRKVMAN